MPKLNFIILLLIASTTIIFGQNTSPDFSTKTIKHKCATDIYLQQQLEKNPALRKEMEKFDAFTADWAKKNHPTSKAMDEILTVPVVFHIVHNGVGTASNISDERIYSQIEALNRDFNRRNADTSDVPSVFRDVAASMDIEFCLAKRDPDGKPTNGITRTESDKTSFESSTNEVKHDETGGKDAWDNSKYLNIWVCQEICGDGDCNILGYAHFPGTTSADEEGIVLINFVTGNESTLPSSSSYNMGRTCVHEAGHYFNLYHTWGDSNGSASCASDDRVADTPRTSEPNFNCPTNSNQCSNETPDLRDMSQNYMDYTDDRCQGIYTLGQKERVRTSLQNHFRRRTLLESSACAVGSNDVTLSNIEYPTNETPAICGSFIPTIEFLNFGLDSLYFFYVDYQLNSEEVQSTFWGGDALGYGESATFELPEVFITNQNNIQQLKITLREPNGLADFLEDDNIVTVNFKAAAIPENNELIEGFNSPFFPPDGWSKINTGFILSTKGGYNSIFSAYIKNYGHVIQENENLVNQLLSPPISMIDVEKSYLTFFTAYALTNDDDVSDILQVYLVDKCNDSDTLIYEVTGDDLISAETTDEDFVPSTENWLRHDVDLSEFAGNSSVGIRFEHTRGTGNNFYIDNVNIIKDYPLSNGEIGADLGQKINYELYPNPISSSKQQSNLQISSPQAIDFQVNILNNLGQVVAQQSIKTKAGDNRIALNTQNLSAGIYFVNVIAQNNSKQQMTRKLVILE